VNCSDVGIANAVTLLLLMLLLAAAADDADDDAIYAVDLTRFSMCCVVMSS